MWGLWTGTTIPSSADFRAIVGSEGHLCRTEDNFLESLFFSHGWNSVTVTRLGRSHLSCPSTALSAVRVRSFNSQREAVYTGNWLVCFLLTASHLSEFRGWSTLSRSIGKRICVTLQNCLTNNNHNKTHNNIKKKTGQCAVLIDNCRIVLLHTHQTG